MAQKGFKTRGSSKPTFSKEALAELRAFGIDGEKLSKDDKRVIKFTRDFINRYRTALEALAKK